MDDYVGGGQHACTSLYNQYVNCCCVAGKRVQETVCLGASVVLIATNFCCLVVHFESCYTYSIIAAACKCLLLLNAANCMCFHPSVVYTLLFCVTRAFSPIFGLIFLVTLHCNVQDTSLIY